MFGLFVTNLFKNYKLLDHNWLSILYTQSTNMWNMFFSYTKSINGLISHFLTKKVGLDSVNSEKPNLLLISLEWLTLINLSLETWEWNLLGDRPLSMPIGWMGRLNSEEISEASNLMLILMKTNPWNSLLIESDSRSLESNTESLMLRESKDSKLLEKKMISKWEEPKLIKMKKIALKNLLEKCWFICTQLKELMVLLPLC